MKRIVSGMLVMAAVLAALPCAAVTPEDFKVKTTQNLIDLCTAPSGDPHYTAAVNFCHGYLVGAYHYYLSENSGPDSKPLFCLPEPAPSRNEAIRMFIDWAKARPQYLQEMPVETQFRFLIETWPCR